MESIEYLRALRRWWYIIIGLAVVGFIVAATLSTSSTAITYTATHALQAPSDSTSVALNRAAFLTRTGDVPRMVAAELGGDPEALASSINAFSDSDLQAVQIEASSTTSERAVQLADTFAEQLLAFLDKQAAEDHAGKLAAAQQDLATAQQAIAVGGSTATLQRNLETAAQNVASLQADGPPTSGFTTLGTTTIVSSGGGTSSSNRSAIGGLMGLLLGIIVALMLARFDTRIRTRENAEEAFEFPVVAEIPLLGRKLRGAHAIVTSKDPESLSAESYRGLRTALVVAANAKRRSAKASTNGDASLAIADTTPPTTPRVVMVVSPGTGEGKTTTVANLAVAFAESGRRVLALGMDLRRPELHGYFDVDESPGLTDALQQPITAQSIESIVQDTQYPGVRIAPSGAPVEHPGELIAHGPELIALATTLADVVIVDTAPLLATDDASALMPVVDEVVVVCRAGRTPNEAASLASELLNRLDAPVVGVAIIGASRPPSARSYYRSDYRARHRARPAKTDAKAGVPATTAPDPAAVDTSAPVEIAPAFNSVVKADTAKIKYKPGGDTAANQHSADPSKMPSGGA